MTIEWGYGHPYLVVLGGLILIKDVIILQLFIQIFTFMGSKGVYEWRDDCAKKKLGD